MMQDRIDDMIDYAWRYVGHPYRWGGDDQSGMDCSGLIVECLKAVGLLRESEDLTADGLMKRFIAHQTTTPEKGCLAFRLDDSGKAFHVVLCIGDDLYIGADGGGHTTVTEADAWKQNAFVKMRPLSKYLPSELVFVDPFEGVA